MVEEITALMTGHEAAAWAVKLAGVKVIVCYPITPASPVIEILSEYVANGELEAESIEIEGEHSCLAAIRGAAWTGVRVFTSTSGPGLAYAHENLQMAHTDRVPIVMTVPTRSHVTDWLAGCADHSTIICESTTGWIQLFCENQQEILDTLLQAYRIVEDPRILLPIMVVYDGLITSHSSLTIKLPNQEDADKFLPAYIPFRKLDPDDPMNAVSTGGLHVPFMEKQHELAMEDAKKVISKSNEEYFDIFGRKYGDGLLEVIDCDDAEALLVTMGSHVGTARTVVKQMREEGKKIGLIKIKSFRPFPVETLCDKIREIAPKAIGVISPQITHGKNNSELCGDVRDTLYDLDDRPKTINFIMGITGTDISPKRMRYAAERTLEAARTGIVENSTEWGWDITQNLGSL
jgi:pyruvate/2-oxoacid:ferredoxin oxidoreductase alpha subunit